MTTTVKPDLSTDLLVHELLVQERAIDRAEERAAAIKVQLVDRLGEGGKAETPEAKVAIVAAVTRVVDVDVLQETASRGFFYKVTKRVVDMPAFKALDALGAVPEEVLEIVTERKAKAAVRLTLKR